MSTAEIIAKARAKLEELLIASLKEYHVPEYMQAGIVRYVVYGVLPGSFLQAIITNDLDKAKLVADQANTLCIFLYVQWFREQAPDTCHGSQEAMDKWVAKNRTTGG